ncbi:MAG: hypothetical protein EXS43_11030 [Opitutus sp.]|nr:hypothetical protein [Opitutus sp.]
MYRVLITLLLALADLASVQAQDVEVTAVKFANLRSPPGANGNWLEADIALNVRPGPGAAGQMVSRVRVTVLLGFELAALAGGERRIEHFRAEAECVVLEAGRANLRFYLPPELVKRDQLHGDPKYWGVELAVAGRPVPAARGSYAGTLANSEQRKSFQTKGTPAATANEGLLQPQYLTPFATEYPRATPSFVRRDERAGPAASNR